MLLAFVAFVAAAAAGSVEEVSGAAFRKVFWERPPKGTPVGGANGRGTSSVVVALITTASDPPLSVLRAHRAFVGAVELATAVKGYPVRALHVGELVHSSAWFRTLVGADAALRDRSAEGAAATPLVRMRLLVDAPPPLPGQEEARDGRTVGTMRYMWRRIRD